MSASLHWLQTTSVGKTFRQVTVEQGDELQRRLGLVDRQLTLIEPGLGYLARDGTALVGFSTIRRTFCLSRFGLALQPLQMTLENR